MLYDAENRMSDRTIASLIRKMFNGEEVSLDDLEEYYYYLTMRGNTKYHEYEGLSTVVLSGYFQVN